MKQRKQEETTLRMELYPQVLHTLCEKATALEQPQYQHHIRAIHHFICNVDVRALKHKDPSECFLPGLLQCLRCIRTVCLVYQFGFFFSLSQ